MPHLLIVPERKVGLRGENRELRVDRLPAAAAAAAALGIGRRLAALGCLPGPLEPDQGLGCGGAQGKAVS